MNRKNNKQYSTTGIKHFPLPLLSDLEVLSWNIQASNNRVGCKFDDPEFMKIFEKGNIICLQEVRQDVKIPGYQSFVNIRPTQKDGGVSISFKKELTKGISQVKTLKAPDTVICKLDKKFFKTSTDIFVVNTYITPDNSSSKSKID